MCDDKRLVWQPPLRNRHVTFHCHRLHHTGDNGGGLARGPWSVQTCSSQFLQIIDLNPT